MNTPQAPTGRDSIASENSVWSHWTQIILTSLQKSDRKSRHRSLAITHLEDVISRLEMDSRDLNP